MNSLISNEYKNYTNVLDSVTVAYHKLCNHGLSDIDFRCPLQQAYLALSESRILEPPGVLDLGGLFF